MICRRSRKMENENNIVTLKGNVDSGLTFSHQVYGEDFFSFTLKVPRLSETCDFIPVTISERLLLNTKIEVGDALLVSGQFRSYNNYNTELGNKLLLSVFAKDVAFLDGGAQSPDMSNPNEIYINGYICKPPIYRKTPFGREISDILVAVNRTYNKSDYIPVIAWGRNARYCEGLAVGDNIKIWGRVQSREYQKKLSEDEVITKTAYEVSVAKMEVEK